MSDQDNYMEGIVELIKRYILHQKLSKSVKNSWRYWGFSCNFAYFADFEDPNWSVLREGVVCSWRLYGMHYRPDQELEFRRNGFQFTWELMEILRFFFSILLILLILRISTGQCFMKERSVHEVSMGWIIEQIVRLNFVETDSDFHENSWRYSGFRYPFCWFCCLCWFSGLPLTSD